MCPSDTTRARDSSISTAPEFRQAFDMLDKDRDGKISVHDLQTFYTDFPSGATEEDISSMVSVADSDKNGFVEFEEFEKVLNCEKSLLEVKKNVMEDMFKVMDRDGDGIVGFDDLKSYMSWAGFNVSDEDIRIMIEVGGGDRKNGVGYEGLMKILALDDDCNRN